MLEGSNAGLGWRGAGVLYLSGQPCSQASGLRLLLNRVEAGRPPQDPGVLQEVPPVHSRLRGHSTLPAPAPCPHHWGQSGGKAAAGRLPAHLALP